MKRLLSTTAALAFIAFASANAAELITNGGFEDGTYTSTINGYTNPYVPVGWTPNEGFDLSPAYNQVRSFPVSGSYNLSIGNFDAQELATLSQTFNDVVGATYTTSFYVAANDGGDPTANFTAAIDGVAQFTTGDTITSYTLETFSFVGTGQDTLTLSAKTNPGEWYADDVSVTGPAAMGVPEPAAWSLMLIGVAGLGAGVRSRRRAALA